MKFILILLTIFFYHYANTQPVFDLYDLNGSNGFTIIAGNEELGASNSGSGDINGDGIDDIAVGAVKTTNLNGDIIGSVYIVYGGNQGFGSSFDVSSLDGTNGFKITSDQHIGGLGYSVNINGDINGDGFDDVLLGAYYANFTSAAKGYVVYGSDSGIPSIINVSNLDGTNGFVIPDIQGNGSLGNSVNIVGDLNNDSIEDFIITSRFDNKSYVVFGSESFTSSLDLNLLDGTNGFVVQHDTYEIGTDTSRIGDINNDLIDDILIGFEIPSCCSPPSGGALVIFGKNVSNPSQSFSPTIDPINDLDGTNGFVFHGEPGSVSSNVGGGGDVNGDQINDIIVGAPWSNSGSGTAYVIYGSITGTFPSVLQYSQLNLNYGFWIRGSSGSRLGGSVEIMSDLNSDNIDDIVVSADRGGSDYNDGATYIIYGKGAAYTNDVLISLLSTDTGLVLERDNIENFTHPAPGLLISSGGDVNNDGVNDLLIGAQTADSWNGANFVYFGKLKDLIFEDNFE